MNLQDRRINDAMTEALQLAEQAAAAGDIPVGAVVLDSAGEVVARGWNTREAEGDPVGHAEVNALRAASKTAGSWHLEDYTLVVTLEPCTMCAGALVSARIGGVVFGAWDEKAGAAGSVRDVLRDSRLNHMPQVRGGVMEAECSDQLRKYFQEKRLDRGV
ncbi:nucleoside deaminase [Boudabousia marimammalium]|uniref:tRNA-specific adenosine deaminase n=1 Tax=Boudabousia marimammalium TaxID=156892 RepID=A0A1Q5PM82_9ACTO|nr:nucleoside deaminase [Boudabousia marimammalium]OKL48646.1 tRNA-specific adenosine deaminase [Boudabousia marimammalium]